MKNRANLHLLHRVLPALLCLLAFAGTANAWWDSDWTLRKKIVIDTSDKGVPITDPIGTVPVLIRLSDANFQFGAAKEDGSDIRFVAEDDKTALTFHIEKIDSTFNMAYVWVKVPDLKPNAVNTIWLYYGNAGNKAVKVEDMKGTYAPDMSLVYHFGESGTPASDATGNGNASKGNVTSTDSIIAGGLHLTGHLPVVIPASPTLLVPTGGAMSWSAWIKPAKLQPNAVIFSRHDGGNGLVIGLDNGIPFAEVITPNGTQRTPAGAPLSAATWHHLAVVAAPSKITVYADGDVYQSVAASLPALNSDSTIGADAPAAAGAPATGGGATGRAGFEGDFDELEISKVARPDGFIKFSAYSQGGSDRSNKLVAPGADEQTKTWLSGNSTFGILIKSLTPDGWAVIGILSIMAIVSWSVMVSKASYLKKNAKGSAQFMKAWHHIAADLTVLDDGNEEKAKTLGGQVEGKKGLKALKNACIYRIYHVGAQEIRHRMTKTQEGRVLSSQSIQAIRASLDGVMTRETQKMNSLMVFLTIAISGGPFLGLLGTVVGVMITFAAIAAAGDVNVNAIAPGIAAALLATVAGLAVAIPALFGYNYLISQIKEATTDMHVFVDEFVTKLAEFYRPRGDRGIIVETSSGTSH